MSTVSNTPVPAGFRQTAGETTRTTDVTAPVQGELDKETYLAALEDRIQTVTGQLLAATQEADLEAQHDLKNGGIGMASEETLAKVENLKLSLKDLNDEYESAMQRP